MAEPIKYDTTEKCPKCSAEARQQRPAYDAATDTITLTCRVCGYERVRLPIQQEAGR